MAEEVYRVALKVLTEGSLQDTRNADDETGYRVIEAFTPPGGTVDQGHQECERLADEIAGEFNDHAAVSARLIAEATPNPLVPSAPSMQAEDVARDLYCILVGESPNSEDVAEIKAAAAMVQRAIDGAVATEQEVANSFEKQAQESKAHFHNAIRERNAANKRADELAEMVRKLMNALPMGRTNKGFFSEAKPTPLHTEAAELLTAYKAAAPNNDNTI